MILILNSTQKTAFRLSRAIVKLNTKIDIIEEQRQDAIVAKKSVSVFFYDEELKNLHAVRTGKIEQLKTLTIK